MGIGMAGQTRRQAEMGRILVAIAAWRNDFQHGRGMAGMAIQTGDLGLMGHAFFFYLSRNVLVTLDAILDRQGSARLAARGFNGLRGSGFRAGETHAQDQEQGRDKKVCRFERR